MKIKKLTEHKFTQRYGMEATGDMWKEWANKEEVKQFEENFSQYVEECKFKDIYGKEYTNVMMMEQDPIFDESGEKTKPTESYKLEIIDFNRNGRKVSTTT